MPIKGQGLTVYFTVWDTANNVGRTGDAANLTLRVNKDGGTPTAPTNSASESDATNQPGRYKITLTAAEMTADIVDLGGKSATADTIVVPIQIVTDGGANAATQALITALNDPSAAAIVAALQAATIEGTITDVEFNRLVLAFISGASSRSSNVVTMVSQGGGVNRLVYTLDNDGQRASVAVNGASS